MRRNRSLIAKTCPSVRGGGGDRGGSSAFHAPSWRIRSRSLSVTTAGMYSVLAIVRLYDVALRTAGPRWHSVAGRWSHETNVSETIRKSPGGTRHIVATLGSARFAFTTRTTLPACAHMVASP